MNTVQYVSPLPQTPDRLGSRLTDYGPTSALDRGTLASSSPVPELSVSGVGRKYRKHEQLATAHADHLLVFQTIRFEERVTYAQQTSYGRFCVIAGCGRGERCLSGETGRGVSLSYLAPRYVRLQWARVVVAVSTEWWTVASWWSWFSGRITRNWEPIWKTSER